MGITKAYAFTQGDNTLASLCKALGHPARVAILRLLLKKKSCICGTIVDELPLSQSTISQHLKELKEAGLIRGTIEGVSICYCIDEVVWGRSKELLYLFFQEFSVEDTCCK